MSVTSQITPPAYTFAYWCPPTPSINLLNLVRDNQDLQALFARDEVAGFAVADWLQEYGVNEQEANLFHEVPGWARLFRDFAPFYRTGVLG